MADPVVDNGGLTDIPVSAKTLSGGADVQSVELVSAVEGGAKTDLLGQKTMAASLPVAVASNQSAIPASQSGTWTVQPGNTANTTAWKVDASSVAVPITDNSGSLTVDNAVISVVGSGTEATAQRVTIATDSTGVLSVDDNGGSLTVDGTVTANVGVPTSGGVSTYHLVSAATNNAQCPKASAGQVFGWNVTNNAVTWAYLKFYNKASAPTPASDTVVRSVGIPPGGGSNLHIPAGMAFSTGIAIAIVANAVDTDNTSVAANQVVIDIDWK